MKRIVICLFLLVSICDALSAQELTFYKDVQPIIQSKCATCHRPGESAPFSLLNYEDVKKRTTFIADVVKSGYMPPWKADNKYVHFANDRSLTPKEKDVLIKWINAKAPEGKQSATAVSTSPLFEGTSYHRKPDLTLKASDSFLVKADGIERFVIFKIPFTMPDSANVEAIEFSSNNKKLIHHVNYAIHTVLDTAINITSTDPFINLTDDDRRKFDQYQPYRKTITYYGGWIPGASYESYPSNIGWVMPSRGVILLTVHFSPSAKEMQSLNGVNLFFKKTPITRKVKVISFGSGGIGEKEIKPGFYLMANEKKRFKLDVVNPGENFSIMYVWPHMHYLGKEYTAYIIKPNGDTTKLVNIPSWDFRWQEIYRFKQLVVAPRGSRLHIEGYYDNTADNPFNPYNPPQIIASTGDMKSTDEMMTLLMVYLPYLPGDENLTLEEIKKGK